MRTGREGERLESRFYSCQLAWQVHQIGQLKIVR